MKITTSISFCTPSILLPIIIFVLLTGSLAFSQTVSFSPSDITGLSVDAPTSLQFGPDGRLYIAERYGLIKVATVTRNAANDYVATATETISAIQQIPNHDDDGTLNPGLTTRQVVGIFVTGTPANPVIYVASSDPRHGGGGGGVFLNDKNLDTNSGVLSKLTWNGTSWVKLDLIRGLPRSGEYHSINGMYIDETKNIMYLTQGGNTNKGAPSNNFVFLPEYALSTAILAIDLNMIGNTTYDLPTLDDEDRPNVGPPGFEDANDPFGGNKGKNQALLVANGPISLYSTGWRNNYDIIITESGKMYSIDNGPNAGWGGIPTDCSNNVVEAGLTYCDVLHVVDSGYYAGHPNPTRANRNNTFNTTNPQTPIPVGMENPVECNYIVPGTQSGALSAICSSTNGLCEYTASNFGNALKGNLLTVAFNGKMYRFELDASGNNLTSQSELASNFGSTPLDVIAQGDGEIFSGTIWVAVFGANKITVFEPNDFVTCVGDSTSFAEDTDGDCFSNADELANNTDWCNPASKPSDHDGDCISDLLDPDDDNDGIPDTEDLFALDPDNGATTFIPVSLTFENNPDGGLHNWGFTGIMNNGSSNYMDQYELPKMTVGGAAVKFTVDEVSSGDAFQNVNTQEYAFQLGVNVGAETNSYIAQTKIMAPFAGFTPVNFQSMGMFIGTGDQDNYLKIVTNANGGAGGIQVYLEINGSTISSVTHNIPILGESFVDLNLVINPGNNTVQPTYRLPGGPETALGSAISIPASWIGHVLAVGFISTSSGSGAPFAATWDYLKVVPAPSAGEWEIVTTTNTCTARHENAFVQAGDKFYLLGGRGIKPVDIFNPADNTWTAGAASPIELHHFQAVEYKGLIYVLGAFTGSYPSETPVPNIYIYDPVANQWTVGPEIPSSRRRGSGGVVVYDDKFYWISGLTNGHINGWVPWVDMYDPSTGEWTALADAPRSRDHFHAALHNGKIYAIAGRNSAHDPGDFFSVWANTIPEVDVYNIATNSWSSLSSPHSDLPTERAGASVAVIDDEIIVIGGETAFQGSAHVQTEALEVNEFSWRTLSNLNTGRHGTQAIVNNDGIYICAGSGNRGGGPELNTMEAFYFFEETTPTGTPIVKGNINSPSSRYFGQLYLGNEITANIHLNANGGNQSLLVTGISLSGSPDFSLLQSPDFPVILSPGESMSIPVKFNPSNTGIKNGTLQVQHSGSNGNLSIALSGEALESIPCGGGDPDNFEEQNGLLVLEVESAPLSGSWVSETIIPNYTGNSYYRWNGSFQSNPTQGILTYNFNISTTGRYKFQIRSYQPGPSGADENDVWAKVIGAQAVKVKNGVDAGNLNNWFKIYQNTIESWTFYSVNTDFNPHEIFIDFPTAGEYSVQLAGRSPNFSVDRIIMYHSSVGQWAATGALPAESPNGGGTGGDCSPELSVWYYDGDSDGFGSAIDSIFAETQPANYVANNDDCDDNNASVYPGAPEIADGLDNNCNGISDEGTGGSGGNGSYEALLVVGNTTLNAGDQAIKNRLETLGFNVTVVGHSASQTSDADGKGLVMISSTITSGLVNTKFTNVPVPLINWEPALHDDLKFVVNGNYGSTGGATQLQIINAAHPLAAGLSNGNVSVFTTGESLTHGNPVGSIKIATLGSPNQVAIFGYETGDPMDGMNAPARRVGFFLHDNGASALTVDGIALLDAAILWASNVSANQSPDISIISPLQNESFSAPATISIAANATDPDGSVSKVEFFHGATLLGQDMTFPYGYNWTNVGAGDYTIIAVVTDNDGATATDTINISVTVPSISLINPIDGQIVVGDEVMVSWTTTNANPGDHVHVTVDGIMPHTSVYDLNGSLLVSGLTSGVHNIQVELANAGHVVYPNAEASKSVDFTSVISISADALLVVGNTTLNTGDQAIKNRLEALGFSVSVVNDITADSTDAVGKSLIVISSTILSSNIGKTFTKSSIPILNFESGLHNDLLMTPGNTFQGSINNQTTISMVNAIHPLSAGLPLGNTTILSTAQTIGWGNPGGNAVKIAVLANDASKTVIFGFDTGVPMVGINAPARRVGFFLKDNGAEVLTTDGLALLDAAILWATNINLSPDVTLTEPLDSALYYAPASINIKADANDSDGTIEFVSFYEGDNLLGVDSFSNYSYKWTNVAPGEYIITAKATDDRGATTTSAPILVIVESSNTPPTFSVSGDITVQQNFASTELVTVIPDPVPAADSGQIVTYSLSPATVDFANVSINSLTGEVTITSVTDSSGSQIFTITADDGETLNNIATQTFTLTVIPPNTPPTFSVSGDIHVDEDFVTTESVIVTPDPVPAADLGQLVTYSLDPASVSFADVSINSATGEVTITAIADDNGSQLFTITADDGQSENNIATQTFTLTVNPVNDAPTFTTSGDVIVLQNFASAESVTVTPDPVPADELGQIVTYTLEPASISFANVSIDSLTGEITITSVADSNGVQLFTIIADDGEALNNIATQNFTLAVYPSNTPPSFSISGDVIVDEDFLTVETVTVTPDPVPAIDSAQIVTYSLDPASVSFADVSINSATGEVTINAIPDANGSQLFTITADDGQAEDNIATQTFTLTVNPVNDPPAFSISGNVTVLENFDSTETVTVTPGPVPADETGQIVTYSLDPAAVNFANVSINNLTGEVSVTAVTDSSGSQLFTIIADDGQPAHNIATQTFTLTVLKQQILIPDPIFINAGGPQFITAAGDTFMADQYYSVPSTAYGKFDIGDIDNTVDDPLYYTERYAANMSYNIPVQNGLYKVQLFFAETFIGVTGSGIGQGVGARVFNVSIEGNAVLNGFDIYAEVGPKFAIIKEYDSVSVHGGTLDIDFTATTNNAKISAIAVIPIGGQIIIPNNTPPAFITSGDVIVDEDFVTTQTVTVTPDPVTPGEESQVVTYSLSPASVSFANVSINSSTGEVSITSIPNGSGTQLFTITANDGQLINNTATATFTLTVNPVNDPPLFTISGDVNVLKNFATTETVTVIPAPVPADEMGQTVTYALIPETVSFANVSINPNTGTVSITSVNDSVGMQLFSIIADDGQGLNNTATQIFTLTVSETAPVAQGIFINAGGPQYVSVTGDVYEADNYFTTPSTAFVNTSIADITNTNDDVLYLSERYGANYSYNIPVTNGFYNVKLHFAEIYLGQPGGGLNKGVGERLFDIYIEGTLTIDNFDIFAEVGTAAALIKEFDSVMVIDGALNLDLTANINNAKLSAIAILPSGALDDSTNYPPVVSITSPANNDILVEGTDLNVTATANDDVEVKKVEFLVDDVVMGMDSIAPYSFLWASLPLGDYILTAKATDNDDASTISAPVNISVIAAPNSPPAVSIINPVDGASFTEPATISIQASASDSDGSIAKVEFYSGGTLLGVDSIAPYSLHWSGVTQGNYSISAIAYDNENATGTSSLVNITVDSSATQFVLLVVGSENLNSGDQAVKNRLESLGLTVEVVDDDLSTTADADDKSLIVISATINSSSVGTKFTNVDVPVVNWEQALLDDLKMVDNNFANRGSINGQTQINIVDQSHPMAAGLPNGPVAVYSSPEIMIYGKPNANAIKVASAASDPSQAVIFGYDSGVAMQGMNAPARRVAIFLHDIGASLLTTNGTALFDAAIIWALNSNTPPSVSITAPDNNANFAAPANISIEAAASDNGSITKVEFYEGADFLGEVLSPPYNFNWTNVAPGAYTLTAIAYDDEGAQTTSAPVSITVTDTTVNLAPTVAITGPVNGSLFTEPAIITIEATASDVDGTIAKVEFYNGAALLAIDSLPPYSFTWDNVIAGSYTLTAVATDNDLATAISSPVTVTVEPQTTGEASVSVTSPANNATFNAPADIVIQAQVDGLTEASPYLNLTNATVGWKQFRLGYDPGSIWINPQNVTATGNTHLELTLRDFSGNAPWDKIAIRPQGSSNAAVSILSYVNAVGGISDEWKTIVIPLSAFSGVNLTSLTMISFYGAGAGAFDIGIREVKFTGGTTPFLWFGESKTNNAHDGDGGPGRYTATMIAGSAGGSITKVEFYNGAILLGQDLTAPYSFNWNNVSAGSYSLTAKAYDSGGGISSSTLVNITVNSVGNIPPSVNITSPANGATYAAPASITINAVASDTDGTITKVEFYSGALLLGQDETFPYSLTWTNAPAGSYALTAKAFDNEGASSTSTVVNVTVNPAGNTAPSVSITSPANGASFNAPASITINATAADTDGTINKVAFYHGETLLAEDFTSPYSFTWNNVPAGSYSLTAVATDDDLATTVSAVINVTVETVSSGPSVTITNPIHNSSFITPANITIEAEVDGFGKLPYINLTNFTKGWKQFRLGYDPLNLWINPQNVTATGNTHLQITLRDFSGNAPWNLLAVRPQGSSASPLVSLASYVSEVGGIGDEWKTVSIPVSAFSNTIDLTKLTMISLYGAGAEAFDIGIQQVKFTGGTTPFVWFGGSKTNNAHDGDGGPGHYFAELIAGEGNSVAKVQFYEGDNLIGEDFTSPYTLDWNNVPSGSYNLTAIAVDNSNSTYTSLPVSVNVNAGKLSSATAIESINLAKEILVYPNPGTGYFTIEFELNQFSDIHVEVFNHLGSRIYITQAPDHKGYFNQGIDLRGLASGVYYVRIKIGEELVTRKLVIRRE